MKQIRDLRDLFMEQGRELYDASRQEETTLRDIQHRATNPELKGMINDEMKTVKVQRDRLERAFKKLNANVEGEKNPCCESILERTRELMDRSIEPEVRDAVIINSIQKLNHLKITGYGSLIAYARQFGEREVAHALHVSLDEERNIDQALTRLAQREVNVKASHAALV